MDLVIVMVVALAGACLSFVSGFGLGTLLLPAFMLFFPPPVAIAATAVVHLLNSIFKLFLVGRYADWRMVAGFGTLSAAGALLGAWLLTQIAENATIIHYQLAGRAMEVTMINVVIAVMIFCFSILEIAPWFRSIRISRTWLPFGGLISGFFGGLSGHQGALRSAFLMKTGLSKEAFLGTRVVCSCLVDVARISIYASAIGPGWRQIDPWIVSSATLAAFLGAWLGNKWMKKTELPVMNTIITIALMVFAIALGLGFI